jgi:hypothetical protein
MSWGAAISAAGSIAGGLAGRSRGRSRQSAREGAVEDARYFYHTVSREAPKYGIHPLYAMGNTTWTPSSQYVGGDRSLERGLVNASQDIGNAVNQHLNKDAKRMTAANIRLAEEKANTEVSMQQYYSSLAARERANANIQKGEVETIPYADLHGTKLKVENLNDYYDSAIVEKDPLISKSSKFPSSTAGTHAGLKEYINPINGKMIMLPYSEEGPAESMESTPIWMWPAIIEANKKRYGNDWDSGLVESYLAPIKRKTKGSRIRSIREVKNILRNRGSRRPTRGK